MSGYVLYDLANKNGDRCWSPNISKARMALSFKGVDYTTEFVDFIDIQEKFKGCVIPNDTAQSAAFKYTVPVLKMGDDRYVMDSLEIAKALEAAHPSPSLNIDPAAIQATTDAIRKAFGPLAAIYMPRIRRKFVTPASEAYFDKSRYDMFGMSLDQFEAEKGGEPAWANAKEPLAELAQFVSAKGGPYLLGAEPSHMDFIIASMVNFMQVLDQASFDRIVGENPALGKHLEACEQWLQKLD